MWIAKEDRATLWASHFLLPITECHFWWLEQKDHRQHCLHPTPSTQALWGQIPEEAQSTQPSVYHASCSPHFSAEHQPKESPGQTESPRDIWLLHHPLSHYLNPHCSLWVIHCQAPGIGFLQRGEPYKAATTTPPHFREVKTETQRHLVTQSY